LCYQQQGKGLIKVNGQPLGLVQPEILRFKVRLTKPNRRRRVDAKEKKTKGKTEI
jgi:hypothetical protein